jgi:hypothetical protein
MKKDGTELEHMYKAAAMVELGMEYALKAIRPGQTEKQVQLSIEQDLRAAGVTGDMRMSVASGERSGIAHNGTGNRTIAEGDLVWVDLMVSYEYYWADITRTFPVGAISPELQQIYQVVLEAQLQQLGCQDQDGEQRSQQGRSPAGQGIEGEGCQHQSASQQVRVENRARAGKGLQRRAQARAFHRGPDIVYGGYGRAEIVSRTSHSHTEAALDAYGFRADGSPATA